MYAKARQCGRKICGGLVIGGITLKRSIVCVKVPERTGPMCDLRPKSTHSNRRLVLSSGKSIGWEDVDGQC